jgi:hypothetical protein
MPRPIKYREFLRRLRVAGWEGPFQHGPHPFLWRRGVRLPIPNPHRGDLDWTLVKRILEGAGIESEDWEELGRK